MSFSDAISAILRIRRVLLLVSVVAGGGAGYKYGPTVCHKVEEAREHRTVSATTAAKRPVDGSITTNSAGLELCSRDLGALSLTNHFDTLVSLGKGKECLVTPVLLDKKTVQLTLTVESKNANGRLHDLSITQVVIPSGRPFEAAVGDFSLSLTPNVVAP